MHVSTTHRNHSLVVFSQHCEFGTCHEMRHNLAQMQLDLTGLCCGQKDPRSLQPGGEFLREYLFCRPLYASCGAFVFIS
jgi:hypothetical protein